MDKSLLSGLRHGSNLKIGRLLELTSSGIYCPAAGIYIDPWDSVEKAIVTHAHGDHVRFGSKSYLCAERGKHILGIRLGENASIESRPFGETILINGIQISFHPAGHIIGSSQIRLEYQGDVTVVSGDYKVEPDVTCDPFVPLKCNTFITESTFGLPIYNWQPSSALFSEINDWWNTNQREGRTSIVLAYSLGKAQRVLAGLDTSIGPIAAHGSVHRINAGYEASGVTLPHCQVISPQNLPIIRGKALVIAPPSVLNTPWLRKLAPYSTSFASGWMLVRGQRRRRGVDRGFALSDHADWNGLITTIKNSEAEEVWATHGFTHSLVNFLNSNGVNAKELKTKFGDDETSSEEL